MTDTPSDHSAQGKFKPAWMAFYPADYIKDTTHLSLVEHGAYLLLICHYWINGGLPEDEKRIARIARMTPDEWRESRDVIAELFQEGWKHKRIEKELKEAIEKYEKRAAAGKLGAQARWQTDGNANSNANANANGPAYAKNDGKMMPTHNSQLTNNNYLEKKENASVCWSQVSPNDPVLQRPDDPLASYSNEELAMLTIEFDLLDVESEISDLVDWCDGKGIVKPNERKNAIYGALKKKQKQLEFGRDMKVDAAPVSDALLAPFRDKHR